MSSKKIENTCSIQITNLTIDTLHGRMMTATNAQSENGREILLIYGQHASLERMQSFAEELSQYGRVVMPDLPGFGGMESLYKIDREPSLECMADYLATFIKLRYKRRRITIVAVSYGFLVVTRMLQKYPDIAKKIDILVSLAGFAHHEDFLYSKKTKKRMRIGANVMSGRSISWFIQRFILNKPFIRTTYWIVRKTHAKMKDADRKEFLARTNYEVKLWKMNDFRTRMRSGLSMLYVDLCKVPVNAKQIQVYFIAIGNDQYFDTYKVEQHLNIIYPKVKKLIITLHAHMPTVVASAAEVAPFIPKKLRKELAKKP